MFENICMEIIEIIQLHTCPSDQWPPTFWMPGTGSVQGGFSHGQVGMILCVAWIMSVHG